MLRLHSEAALSGGPVLEANLTSPNEYTVTLREIHRRVVSGELDLFSLLPPAKVDTDKSLLKEMFLIALEIDAENYAAYDTPGKLRDREKGEALLAIEYISNDLGLNYYIFRDKASAAIKGSSFESPEPVAFEFMQKYIERGCVYLSTRCNGMLILPASETEPIRIVRSEVSDLLN